MPLPIFPALPGQMFPTRTPLWNTIKQDAISGAAQRIPLQSYPRYRYTLDFEFLRSTLGYAEMQQLEALYNTCFGAGAMFLFDDPQDDTVAAQGFGEGDGQTTDFQLVRSLGGFAMPVWCPNVIAAIKVAGTPTTAYSLGETGMISFEAPPASGSLLTWDGTFRFPCYFDDDSVDFAEFLSGFWELKSLKFTTVKL